MSYRFRNRLPRSGSAPSHRAAPAVPPPPGPDATPARHRPGPRTVLCQLLIGLTVTVGLSSSHLEATASSLPFGAERSVALAVARPLHRLAAAAGLDRADRAVTQLLGRSTDKPDPAPSPAVERPAIERPAIEAAAGTTDGAAAAGTTDGAALADPTAAGRPSSGDTRAGPVRYGPPRPGHAAASQPASTASTAGDPAAGSAVLPAPGSAPGSTPAPGLGPAVVDPVVEVAAAPPRAITADARLRLWAGGDSLGEYVGNQLLAPLSDRNLTAVELDFHIGTGLTRPDTYSWQARIDEVMARPEPPEALVFMVGGNDNQPMRANDQNLAVGSEPWLAEYRARVTGLMEAIRPRDPGTGSSHLWWIGLPPMRDGERDGLARSIDAIVVEEAAGRPWVTFVDLTARFSGPDGGFAGTVTGPDGKATVARAPDGIHINYAGSTWIAEDLWAEITAHWGLPDG